MTELDTVLALAQIACPVTCNIQYLRENVRDEAKHGAGASSRDLVVAGGRRV